MNRRNRKKAADRKGKLQLSFALFVVIMGAFSSIKTVSDAIAENGITANRNNSIRFFIVTSPYFC